MARRRRKSKRGKWQWPNGPAKWLRKLKKKQSLILTWVLILGVGFGLYHFTHARKPAGPAKPLRKAVTVTKPVVLPAAKPPAVRLPAAIPPAPILKAGGKPKIAFVIDDIGQTKSHRNLLSSLGNKVTYAILPQLAFSTPYAMLGRRMGATVMLHLPLEAHNKKDPGPGLIKGEMSDQEIINLIAKNISTVPTLTGVNNHMGSAGTEDSRVMRIVLRELNRRKLFFLDSRTTLKTVAPEVAASVGIPFLKRDVFLDNIDDAAEVRRMIRKTAQIASDQGYAVAIGHFREVTLRVLSEEIPRLEKEGYEVVPLPSLLRKK
ncbi:MAG: divergent polysaccharide deacetylase family protein [Candidatus Omnitrophota bacterium]|jgi:hypothetical protein